ncbi:hypothetical protein SAMN04487983_1004199 [Streptomyces sp. yr375]|uniref:hypothetical protein n=1 Tax=Streptomyces sp. yr375 TaxID=1761906 RepID=UPI0008BB5E39|nr:hypothetical protein [Streptomyces sp. yr375]SEQ34172.1 hypothetical protein SAMN04487983_1004199 [Streptomyces sp. yr375]
MTDHYPYRITSRTADLLLIWRPGEGDAPDVVAVDERGRLLTFPGHEALREQCDRNRWELVPDGEGTLDLDAVQRWVECPHGDSASAGLLLEAWNFFEDLARSLPAGPPLPVQGPVHDSAYEKVFGGEDWTEDETTAVRELLRTGLDLWEQATDSRPGASGTPTAAGPGTPPPTRP